jgi:putative ABC transport system permease protein
MLPGINNAGFEIVPGPAPFFYCAGLAVIVALACGLTPGLISSQVTPIDGLKAGRLGHVVRGLRLQSVLVGGQVAASFLLLTTAFVLLHTFFLLRMVDPGYDIIHTAAVDLRPLTTGSASPADLKAALEVVPGVEVTAYGALPLGILPRSATIHRPESPDGPRLAIDLHPAGPGFLETMRIPLVRGRDLDEQDLDQDGIAGAVVNETFVQRYLMPGNPIGQQIVLDRNTETGRPDRRLRIAGVVRNTRMRSLTDEGVPMLYLAAQTPSLVIRMRDSAATQVRLLERVVSERFPGALVTVTPMSTSFRTALLPSRIAGALLTALGAIGLILAMIGLHGIVSFGVSRRSFEIGVRLALGATRKSIVKLILRGATRVMVAGAAIGALLSLVVLQALRPFLAVGQSTLDPVAVAGVTIILLVAGAAASVRPARRAASADATTALKSE